MFFSLIYRSTGIYRYIPCDTKCHTFLKMGHYRFTTNTPRVFHVDSTWNTRGVFVGFAVESTKVENVIFPYKTVISEANVKTNRMRSTKWTHNKERSLTVTNFFLFWRFCFSLRTSCKQWIWCNNNPNAHIRTFF